MSTRSKATDPVRRAKADLVLAWAQSQEPSWKNAMLNEQGYARLRQHGLTRTEVHEAIRDLTDAGRLDVELDVRQGGVVLKPVEETASDSG